MSSDYKAHGSISVNQITPQRKTDDTFFGELVLKNAKTGDNVAQNIRDDIFTGNLAKLRGFEKRGTYVDPVTPANNYEYTAKINFPSLPETELTKINIEADVGRTVDTLSGQKFRDINERDHGFAQYSMNRNLYFEVVTTSIGGIDVSGTSKLFREPTSSDINLTDFEEIYFEDDSIEVTTIPLVSTLEASIEDGTAITYLGFYTEYTSGGRTYMFFSTDSKYAGSLGVEEDANIFPIISLQDNWNSELPYEACFGPEHPEYIKRDRPLKAYGIEFEEISRQIMGLIPPHGSTEWDETYEQKWANSLKLTNKYATSLDYYTDISSEVNIPPYQSDEWNRSYALTYRNLMRNCIKPCATGDEVCDDMQQFCTDNPTELDYYNGLVDDKEKTLDGQKNITDVHLGIFASAKKLGEESSVALYYTLAPILGKMLGGSDGYTMSLEAGSLKIDYAFKEWSLCRRFGIADPIKFPPGIKEPKVKHGDYTIDDEFFPDFDIGDTYNVRDDTFLNERAPVEDLTTAPDDPNDPFNPTDEINQLTHAKPVGYIELRVQDVPDPITGESRFLELRLIGPTAKHLVDVIKDGEHGRSGMVNIQGGLENFYAGDPDTPYSDVLVYPISNQATREVRFFKRERFRRECTIVIIGSIQMQETKWYQTGLFKVFTVIISLALMWFFGPMAYNLVALIQAAATMAVIHIISIVVENPWLKAILAILTMVVSGYIDGGSLSGALNNPSLWMEASGAVVNAKIADEMIKLQEEMKEFREMVNKKEKEMEKMKLETGMDDYNAEWLRHIASLTPVETYEDFMDRTLNLDIFDSVTDNDAGIVNRLPAPK